MSKNKIADPSLEGVISTFTSIPEFDSRFSHAIRQAFDEVIDGARTGRWSIEQLSKTEKTYIGTKIEIIIRTEFALERGKKLDNYIAGHKVDTKFSLTSDWMIPNEAVGEICLLIAGNDKKKSFEVGVVRIKHGLLNAPNQDKKRKLSRKGRSAVRWLIRGGNLESNFFAELAEEKRSSILAVKEGQARVTELFRQIQNKLIPRYVITLLGRQEDPMKRARDARKALQKENIAVLCGRYHKTRISQLGFQDIRSTDWLSVDENSQ